MDSRLQTLLKWASWITDIRDMNPSDLTEQHNVDLRTATEILTNTNRVLHCVARYTSIESMMTTLDRLEDETWAKIFESQPEGFHHVLVGIVTKNFFCGLSKDDFSGAGATFVRSLFLSWRSLLPNAKLSGQELRTYPHTVSRQYCMLFVSAPQHSP